MSCARSGSDYLAARDARQAQILAACAEAREARAGAVLVAGANLPGPDKDRQGLERLLRRGLAALANRGAQITPAVTGTDLLGPYAILLAREPAAAIKALAVALERDLPGGRLLDLDVLTPNAEPVDRRSLGLEPRCCYVCDQPAHDCMRLARHSLRELLAAVDAHLASANAR